MTAQPTDGDMATVLLVVGSLFVLALVADLLGRRTPLPRVSVLLLLGFGIGPGGFDLLPDAVLGMFPVLTTVALTMVGFLLGGQLTPKRLRGIGHAVLGVSLGVVFVTWGVVTAGLLLAGTPADLAVLLGGIATATDPAATTDVIREQRARGRFPKTLLGIVAIDDAWGLVLFGLLIAAVHALSGHAAPLAAFGSGFAELGLAVATGLATGLPVAYLTGRIEPGEPTQAEALGAVLLTAGLSLALDVSYLLSAMVMGLTVAWLARHHSRPFHAIEGIEWPFLVLFFLLAGAELDASGILAVGVTGGLFIVLRIAGRLLGARLGGRLAGVPGPFANRLGVALLPQAGVTIGLALLAAQHLPDHADVILPIAIGSTVVFEVFGPVAARLALRKAAAAGEATLDRAS